MNEQHPENHGEQLANNGFQPDPFTRRVLLVAGIAALVGGLLLLLWYALDVLLIVFAGLLLATLLNALSEWVGHYTGLSHGWSLLVVLAILTAILVAIGTMLAGTIAQQIDQLATTLPKSVEQLRKQIEQYQWGQFLIARTPSAGELFSDHAIMARAGGAFSTTLGALATLVIILFIGLYIAAQPDLYRNGLLRLVPPSRRERASEVFDAVTVALRRWLLGQLVAMVVIGVLSTTGLWLLSVPVALGLGLIAALLNFIPNIGPIVSAVPALLLAMTDGMMQAVYVALLYTAIQTFESYFLTPYIQQKSVNLPPVLTITAQVLLGVLAGVLGLALATPLTAVALVLVQMLYIEDLLGDEVELPGENSKPNPATSP